MNEGPTEHKRRNVIPEEPPQLLPGRTAYSWTGWWTASFFLALPGLPFVLAGLLDSPIASLIADLGGASVIAWALIGTGAAAKSLVTGRREVKAGYTTLNGRGYRRFWQLDPKTGAAIRRPGKDA